MEKDILNILDNKNKRVEEDKKSGKKIAEFLNNLDSLNEERLKSNKYNNEIATIIDKQLYNL